MSVTIDVRPLDVTGQYEETQHYTDCVYGEATEEVAREFVEATYGDDAAESVRPVAWSGSDYGFTYDGREMGIRFVAVEDAEENS